MKDYKNALNEFVKTTLLDDKDAESFYYLGLCYKNLIQKIKACENLQKAINWEVTKPWKNTQIFANKLNAIFRLLSVFPSLIRT